MARVAWWAVVHRVGRSWTWLKWLSTHAYQVNNWKFSPSLPSLHSVCFTVFISLFFFICKFLKQQVLFYYLTFSAPRTVPGIEQVVSQTFVWTGSSMEKSTCGWMNKWMNGRNQGGKEVRRKGRKARAWSLGFWGSGESPLTCFIVPEHKHPLTHSEHNRSKQVIIRHGLYPSLTHLSSILRELYVLTFFSLSWGNLAIKCFHF